MLLGPRESPRAVFGGEFADRSIGSIVISDATFEIVGMANVKTTCRNLQDVDGKHIQFGSRGRIWPGFPLYLVADKQVTPE